MRSLVFCLLFCGSSAVQEVNPIRKIVTLMQDMQKEIQGQLDKEKELFERFMCICTNYPAELSETVETNQNTIKQLESKVEQESAEQKSLEQDLKGHYEDQSSAQKDLEKATSLREKEQQEATSSLANAKSTLAGVSQVLPVLEKGASGGASAALLQGPVASKLSALIAASSVISPTDRDSVVSFLNSAAQGSQDYAPQSGQIVGILKQMKDDMEHSVKEQEQAELIAKDAFSDLKGAKDDEIAIAGESISSKEMRAGELGVSVARAKDDLEDTQNELDDAQAMLHTLTTQCGSRKRAFEARLKVRNDEISAISEAIKVLNDDDALDVFKKSVPDNVLAALVQKGPKTAGFLQVHHNNGASKLDKALAMVRAVKGKDLHMSFLLNSMSLRMRAAQRARQAPDMSGVVRTIEGMIDLLNKEQADDEAKKEWCYQEGKKADKQLDTKQDALERLKARGEELADDLVGIGEDIKALEASIAHLDKEVSEATEQRKKEHEEYASSAKLAEVAVQLLEKAKNKLMKFYNPAAFKEEKKLDEASFLQIAQNHEKVAPMPELPDLPEYKQQNEGGIVALMDQIKNELLRDKQEAEFDEKQAQTDYVGLMSESAESRAQDAKSLVAKKSAKAESQQKIIQTKEQTKLAMDETMNANRFVADVHTSCDFLLESFNDKTAARTTELDGLKQAKAMLAADR